MGADPLLLQVSSDLRRDGGAVVGFDVERRTGPCPQCSIRSADSSSALAARIVDPDNDPREPSTWQWWEITVSHLIPSPIGLERLVRVYHESPEGPVVIHVNAGGETPWHVPSAKKRN